MGYGLSLCASLISRVAMIRDGEAACAAGDRNNARDWRGARGRRDLVRPLTVSAFLFPLALQSFGNAQRLARSGTGPTQEIGEAREGE